MRPLSNRLVALAACATSLLACVVVAQEKTPFHTAFPIGALRNAAPADAKVAASVLLKRIADRQGYDYSTEVPETNEEFVKGLRAQRYDFFLIESLDYLKLSNEIAMTPHFAGSSGESDPMETFLLLVRSDMAAGGLAGLEGKRLFYEKGGQSLAQVWLEVQMAEQGLGKPESHFAEIEIRAGCADCALPVFFSEADACIVTQTGFEIMAELNPQLSQRLSVVEASEPMLISLMCLRDGFEERNPGQIDEVSTNLHNTPDGRQILNLMRVQRLVLWEERFITSVQALLERRRLLQKPLTKKVTPTPVRKKVETPLLGRAPAGGVDNDMPATGVNSPR